MATGSDGAPLTVLASVRRFRRASNVAALPESASHPKAESKWNRDLNCLISEVEWAEKLIAIHKAPTSGRICSFAWRLLHRRLPLLGYTHVTQHYNCEDVCPLCASDRETELQDVAIGMGIQVGVQPRSSLRAGGNSTVQEWRRRKRWKIKLGVQPLRAQRIKGNGGKLGACRQ